MMLHVAQGIIANTDQLTRADQAIGDGDHGVGMARGFTAVEELLTNSEFASIHQGLKAIGTTLMSAMGGASGAVFGTLFRGGAGGLQETTVFDSHALYNFLDQGYKAIQIRGGAEEGDKTMLDALGPAVRAAREHIQETIDRSLLAIAAAAEEGKEATKTMVAVHGKAKTLGERSLGYVDPGALSMSLICRLMADYAASLT